MLCQNHRTGLEVAKQRLLAKECLYINLKLGPTNLNKKYTRYRVSYQSCGGLWASYMYSRAGPGAAQAPTLA